MCRPEPPESKSQMPGLSHVTRPPAPPTAVSSVFGIGLCPPWPPVWVDTPPSGNDSTRPSVSPGPIDTPIFDNIAQTEEEINQIKANLVAAVPIGRMGSPDEIAKGVSFLASDDSSYITGIELYTDGGMAQI